MNELLTILLAIHIMLALGLIGVVLLQRSEGGLGGLGGGGMSGFMTTRGTANLLTRTTRWLAGAFMATSLVLAWIATHSQHTTGIGTTPASVVQPIVPAPEPSGSAGSNASPPTTATGTETVPLETAPAPSSTPAVPTNQ